MANRGIFLALGSNMGSRSAHIDRACRMIIENGIDIVNESSLYITEPWGKTDQSDFINCIIEINTSYMPMELLNCTMGIEQAMKRERTEHWGPRIIDIDIILYNDIIQSSKDLVLPHKYIKERYFWLYMLDEMQPDISIPPGNETPGELMNRGIKKQKMVIFEKRKYSQWR